MLLTRICLVGVLLQVFHALGKLELVLVDDGVKGEVAATDDLASVAMAAEEVSCRIQEQDVRVIPEDMLWHDNLHLILDSAAVAGPFVLGHDEGYFDLASN